MGRPAKYPPEFRREAVNLVRSSGRPVAEVARSLEIAEGTLWNWVKADREAVERAGDPDALTEPEREELRRLRKRVAQQEIDLEILRKAAAYFARETNR
jgi:transposase